MENDIDGWRKITTEKSVFDGTKEIIVETDQQPPKVIAKINNDQIQVACGYIVRLIAQDEKGDQ